MAVINARNTILTEDGEVKTQPHDISTPAILLPFAQVLGTTTLDVEAVQNAYTISVDSVVGMVVGQHLRIVDPTANRFYAGTILTIADPIITLDSPIDYAYAVGAEVTFSNTDLAVNGSVSPVIFRTRTGTLSVASRVDVTRLLMTCITDTPVTLPAFGDLSALTNGLALRITRNGVQNNILNVKSNQEIINLAYDFQVFRSTNPAQGVDGFSSRLTFAGHNKIGAALRIRQDENIELLVQDNLTGLLSLKIIFEGHITPE